MTAMKRKPRNIGLEDARILNEVFRRIFMKQSCAQNTGLAARSESPDEVVIR